MSTAAKNVTLSLDIITATVRLEGVKEGTSREATQFNEGHDCGKGVYTKLERQRRCPHCNVDVAYEDITKLRPVDGGFAPFTQEEIRELKQEALVSKKGTIALTPHKAEEVLPHALPNGQAYYVYPDVSCNMDAYSAMYDMVQRRSDMAFCTIFSIREGSEYMGRLTIINDTLAIEVLCWPGDIAKPKTVDIEASDRARAFMDKIVDAMVEDFSMETYRSQFRDMLSEAEKSRVAGEGGIAVASLTQRQKKSEADFFTLLEAAAEKATKPKRKSKSA